MRTIVFLITTILLISAAVGQGTLYVSDFSGNQVLRYDATSGNYLDTLIAGGGDLVQPHGLLDRGTDLLVASAVTDEVLRYDRETGDLLGTFISGASGINYPVAMAIGPDELLYVSSQLSNEVRRFHAETGALVDVFIDGDADVMDTMSGPSGFAFGPDGRVYVAGRFSGTVTAYDGTTGAFDETIADTTDGLAAGSTFGLQFGSNGDLYFASGSTYRYDLVAETLTPIPVGGIGLEVGPAGEIVIASNNNLRRIDLVDNSVGPPLLGSGGTIGLLNFFHYSFADGPSADFDGDGGVDADDLTDPTLGWQARYGNDLGGTDFLAWQQQFEAEVGTSVGASIIPEPQSAALVLAGLLLLAGHTQLGN